ncbi:PDR/VanB family oxidoreductase [Nocardiopsis sp. N85]
MYGLGALANRLVPVLGGLGPGHPPLPPSPGLRARVERVTRPVPDVAEIVLVPELPEGPLPAWQPGHHVDVVLDPDTVRQYSLCGDPGDRSRYRIAVRRIPDGVGSSRLHALEPGDVIGLRGPRNAFPFARAERYLFVAGGIGVTPILPMVAHAHRAGVPFRVVYTGRSRASMPFLDELPEGADVTVRPDDEYGTPDADAIVRDPAPGTAVYVCGPPPLIAAVRARVGPENPVFSERFSPAPVVDGREFEIRLGEDGPVVTVPADETALDVIRRVRPQTPYSCRQGFCGACRVGLLRGNPEHRDRPTGGSPRGEEFALCVSRAAEGAHIVVDL